MIIASAERFVDHQRRGLLIGKYLTKNRVETAGYRGDSTEGRAVALEVIEHCFTLKLDQIKPDLCLVGGKKSGLLLGPFAE